MGAGLFCSTAKDHVSSDQKHQERFSDLDNQDIVLYR